MSITDIEWAQLVWNPLGGCSLKSPGCANCYAMREAHRLASNPNPKIAARYAGTTKLGSRGPIWTGKVNLAEDVLNDPLKRRRPARYFVNSMSDLFHEDVPESFIDRVFAVMMSAYWHTFLVLTKRADRMGGYLGDPGTFDRISQIGADIFDWGPELPRPAQSYVNEGRRVPWNGAAEAFVRGYAGGLTWPLSNVWPGFSAENQEWFDRRAVQMAEAMRAGWMVWVSAEPLLGPITARGWDGRVERNWLAGPDECGIRWVVAGGESGHGARPMHPDWPRRLRDECQAAGTPYFFKQWGAWVPAEIIPGGDLGRDVRSGKATILSRDGSPNDGHFRRDRGDVWISRVGKKAAGRLLDGREWNDFPTVAPAQEPSR